MLLKLQNVPADTVCHDDPRPVRISVAMMVGNEAHFIADAIKSAAWADEVVVLDTGSTDGTDAIAASLGARVTREPWRTVDLGDGLRSIDDFASARNRSIELCTGDWVVLLDADERFDCPDLRALLEVLPDAVAWGSMALDHVGRSDLDQTMNRIYRRAAKPTYEHRLHETLCERVRHMGHVEVPREIGRVVHLGGAHDTRAKLRREERNWRLVQRMLADDPNDLHALSYAVMMLHQFDRHAEAEVLANLALRICTPETASRHRIVQSVCEYAQRRGGPRAVMAVLEHAFTRWQPNAECIAAYGLARWLAGADGAADVLRVALADRTLSVVMREQCERALARLSEVAHAAE